MSAHAYIWGMTVLKTPADLGHVIRNRRKALGWDQARLAYETGVSRQWVIDIEKGKPRAELQLVLRVMNVLGVPLTAALPAPSPAVADLPRVDINAIVERHRLPQQGRPRAPGKPGTLSYAEILEQARRELPPSGTTTPPSVHELHLNYPATPKKGT